MKRDVGPRLGRALARLLLPRDHHESVVGDLEELHARRVRTLGRVRANLRYIRDVLASATAIGIEPLRSGRRSSTLNPPSGAPAGLVRSSDWRHEMDLWTQDLRQAARSLRRAPSFTAITVLTLALAIGANTAIFSVVDRVLIDPLPFPNADRLVAIAATAPGSDLPEEFGPGTEFYVQYREHATALEDLALFQTAQTSVQSEEQVERLFISSASPSLFSTLGVTPILGRVPTEDDPEGQVIVLSHWLWSSWFGEDPEILGESLEVSGTPRTIVGVMGPDLRFPQEETSLWVHDLPSEPVTPGGFGLNLVGRMTPDADHETLSAELATLASRLPERFGGSPAYARIIEQHRPVVRSLAEQMVGDIAGPLQVLLGTVAIVLLIACANVANLLFVRAEGRRRDLAVRRAHGAGRIALVRLQMAEALLIAGAAGVVGLLLAWVGVPILVRAAPEGVPGLSSIGLDWSALAFTAGVAFVAAFASGLLPALRFSTPGVMAALRDSLRVSSGSNHLTRNALVVVQTAAALVLLVGSGLLLQSFQELNRVDPGYETEDIFTFQMAPDGAEHGLVDGPSYARFHYDFMDRLMALPGVESVGVVNALPLDEGAGQGRVVTERSETAGADNPLIRVNFAGGDYFETMGIALLRGQDFERSAEPTGEVRAIVSRAAAELLWPGEDPMDQRLRPAGSDTTMWMSVGGVVEDVVLADFRDQEPEPIVYMPMVGHTAETWAVGTPAYVVKSERAETIAPEVRELIREVAPSAPMYRIFTMRALAARSMADLSFTMLTLAVAAGLALILGAVGIYGVLAYVVSQRTREIGIRMALGAGAAQVRRMVVTQGGRVALVGVAVGLVLALLLTRVLDSLLYGVEPIDLPTLAVVSALMMAVALLASYGPARKASAVDPMESLRAD